MALRDLFSDRNEEAARDDLLAGNRRARGTLGRGAGELRQGYGDALGFYEPFADAYGAAAGTYADALGLRGPEGNARAVEVFKAGPGYQFQMEQGLDALDRRAASRGMLASGNNNLDTLQFSQGLASQEYGGWLDRLLGASDRAVGIADRRSDLTTGQGRDLYGYYGDLAGLDRADAEARANYNAGRDQSGANVLGAIFGGLNLGAKLLGLGGR